ncbi:MAG: FdtA/QdtA family cupin domain-containing protein [Candidatus Paceibacterota bacterium]
MKNNFYEIIDFPFHSSEKGSLVMFQNKSTKSENILPFDIKKILVIKDIKESDIRGEHTHHKTRQILFVINGSCTVKLDNGKEKASVSLDAFNKGIVLEPYVWHTMDNFKSNTILLVLADTEYDEKDYIRNYDDFLSYIK